MTINTEAPITSNKRGRPRRSVAGPSGKYQKVGAGVRVATWVSRTNNAAIEIEAARTGVTKSAVISGIIGAFFARQVAGAAS